MPNMCSNSEDEYRKNNPGVIRLYDATLDDFRDATQDDMDRTIAAASNGAKVREFAQNLHTIWQKEFDPSFLKCVAKE